MKAAIYLRVGSKEQINNNQRKSKFMSDDAGISKSVLSNRSQKDLLTHGISKTLDIEIKR